MSTPQQQQQQQHEQTILTVKALEEAVALLFQNNFDADSQACLVTVMKILDNVLHKPGNDKVRKLRLSNAAVWNKVGQRKGGIELLEACGFVKEMAPPPLLDATSSGGGETCLVLPADREDQSLLITARRLLHTRAVQDLKMDPNQLPAYRPPPPPPVVTLSATANTSGNNNNNSNAFNVYAGHRYDAKSAAVGTNLGPPREYQSITATQLSALQKKQASLERQMHQQPVPRQWQAFAPAGTTTSSSGGGAVASAATAPSTTTTGTTGGDSSLLAARMQQQSAQRQQREEGGFTTAAMRELERLKKQKVYSHVTLTIQFPTGHAVRGQFLPKETIAQVIAALQSDCLVWKNNNDNDDKAAAAVVLLDLYVTPPRRLLPATQTLQQEGLVPAAKVFVSWKTTGIARNHIADPSSAAFLQPHLFLDSTAAGALAGDDGAAAAAFPTAQPVATAPTTTPPAAAAAAETQPSKKKKSKSDRQEEMLKRMMGK